MAKTASKSKKAAPPGRKKPGRSAAKKKSGKKLGSKRMVDPEPGRDPFEL
jgi:hypothetical protein